MAAIEWMKQISDRVSFQGDSNPVIDYNEFEYIRKVRYMTSIEAYTRIHGYPIVQKSHTVGCLDKGSQ